VLCLLFSPQWLTSIATSKTYKSRAQIMYLPHLGEIPSSHAILRFNYKLQSLINKHRHKDSCRTLKRGVTGHLKSEL
jgi:hypothetical protein